MRHVRRVLGTVVALLVIACGALVSPPAAAQGTDVTLQLLRQSPWSYAHRRSTLALEVLAANGTDQTLTDLRLAVSFGPRLATQTDVDQMLQEIPTTPIANVDGQVRGQIAPGDSRTIAFTTDLAELTALDQADSQTYPATVQLVSAGTVVASLVTPVIYLAQEPSAPMLSSAWVELNAPVAFDPAGSLTDAAFPSSLAPEGSLGAPVAALAATTRGRDARGVFDLVIDPLAVTQARSVASGYRTATGTDVADTDPAARRGARFMRALSATASNGDHVEAVAQPYATPLLPAMLADGLDEQLASERVAGQTVVSSLGASPEAGVARPSGGAIDDPSLAWLASVQTSVVLANADTVDRSVVQTAYAPAPTVPVQTARGATTMVLPDPSVQSLFARSDLLANPVLAAQMVLGQLAVIWKQEPVPTPPTVRGIAIAPPSTLPAGLWSPLLERLARAPFLRPVTATDLVRDVVSDVPNGELPLAQPSQARFSPSYADEIRRQSDRIEAYGSMVSDPNVATALRRTLFIATRPEATIDVREGQPWIDEVQDATQRAFDVVTPSVNGVFTFTSREGTIPLVMGDPGGTPLKVTIELASNAFTFPDGNTKSGTVSAPGTVWSFKVLATSSGQQPIQIITRAPNGREIAPRKIVQARSTAANGIALLVTALAALGLLLLYSRRWWRRRTNPTSAEAT
jgi:hypothetical protein